MAAQTKDRITPQRAGVDYNDPVAAGAVIHAGALVVLDAAGNAAPGTVALGLSARGVAQEHVDNTGGAVGAVSVNTVAGIFLFANDATVTRADISKPAFIVDDQTVANNDGTATRSAAGTITDVDAEGVWVQIG